MDYPCNELNADKWGFIPIDRESQTVIPGIMAAGDICSKDVRQIVNAAGEGAVAVLAAERYLTKHEKIQTVTLMMIPLRKNFPCQFSVTAAGTVSPRFLQRLC